MSTNSNKAYSGLEVLTSVNDPNDKYVYNNTGYSNLEPTSAHLEERQNTNNTNVYSQGLQSTNDFKEARQEAARSVSKSPKRKKKKLIIGGIVAGVVIIALIGGVCGALLSKKSSSSSDASSTNSSSTITAPPTESDSVASMAGDATIYPYYDAPAVVSWGYPHMDVVIVNDSLTPLWLSRYPNAKSTNDWHADLSNADNGPFVVLGGGSQRVTDSIAAIARGGNQTDLFVVALLDRGLWGMYHDNTMAWSSWWYPVCNITGASKRTYLYSGMGVASWAQTRIDIFALNENGELWQFFKDELAGGWGNWIGFGGNFRNVAPMVVSWGENRYDVFLVNNNGTLAYKYYDGAWSPSQTSNRFYDLGGRLSSRPFAVTTGVGAIDVFARGGDAGLWHNSFNGSWSGWSRMGPSSLFIKATPSAVVLGNTMHVFVWSDSNELLYASFDWTKSNGQEAQFDTIATGLSGAPTAISDGVNVEVFAHVQENRLGWKLLVGGKQWSPNDQTMTFTWSY